VSSVCSEYFLYESCWNLGFRRMKRKQEVDMVGSVSKIMVTSCMFLYRTSSSFM